MLLVKLAQVQPTIRAFFNSDDFERGLDLKSTMACMTSKRSSDDSVSDCSSDSSSAVTRHASQTIRQTSRIAHAHHHVPAAFTFPFSVTVRHNTFFEILLMQPTRTQFGPRPRSMRVVNTPEVASHASQSVTRGSWCCSVRHAVGGRAMHTPSTATFVVDVISTRVSLSPTESSARIRKAQRATRVLDLPLPKTPAEARCEDHVA